MTYLELFDVRGKTALVTGARKGIGFAIASALAEHGANLIVVSSQQTPNDELSKIAADNGVSYTTFACDFRSRQETLELIEKVKDFTIDILINNAGLANRAEALDHTERLFSSPQCGPSLAAKMSSVTPLQRPHWPDLPVAYPMNFCQWELPLMRSPRALLKQI